MLSKRLLLRFRRATTGEARSMCCAFAGLVGFVFAAGCSAIIVLLKETPFFMNRFLWDVRDSAEEIIAVPGYVLGALIGYEEPYTTGFASGRFILISLTNGLIGAAAFVSAVWGFRYIRRSLDLSQIDPSAHRVAFRSKAATLAMLGGAATFLVTVLLLGLPLVIREGVKSSWFQFVWPIVGSPSAAFGRIFGSELQTAFYTHPVLVTSFCGLLNGLLVGVIIFSICIIKFTIANKEPV